MSAHAVQQVVRSNQPEFSNHHGAGQQLRYSLIDLASSSWDGPIKLFSDQKGTSRVCWPTPGRFVHTVNPPISQASFFTQYSVSTSMVTLRTASMRSPDSRCRSEDRQRRHTSLGPSKLKVGRRPTAALATFSEFSLDINSGFITTSFFSSLDRKDSFAREAALVKPSCRPAWLPVGQLAAYEKILGRFGPSLLAKGGPGG